MNIEYINAIPLREIFDKLKLIPVQQNNLQSFYPSPFQQEGVHTIEVYHDTNTWYDNATKTSGGPLELIAAWLQYKGLHCAVPDVKKWFRFNIRYPSLQLGITLPARKDLQIKFVYKSPILDPALINFIEGKGIPIKLAREHLYQLGLTNIKTGKEFSALGLKTEEGDWRVLSPYINTFIGNKSVSHVRGSTRKFRTVHIFKDVFDYLAAVICVNGGQPLDDESIILNAYECLDISAAYIRGFRYARLNTWLDHDKTSRKVTAAFAELCRSEENLKHEPMNILYADYPGISAKLLAYHKQVFEA